MATILIAGEDIGCLAILESELSAEGHEVITAPNGQDAYDRALGAALDAVFLELNMPVFNGYETCRLLRDDPDVPPGLPIILLTSTDVNERAMEKAGPTDRLPKRHQAWELRELLSKHLKS